MRYLILVLLNTPVIVIASLNLITKYKLKQITKKRLIRQVLLWSVLLIVLIASFPLYNTLTGRPLFDSHELSLFDIVQTTAIIILLGIANNLRQKNEHTSRMLRTLHEELSIRLSETKIKNDNQS